MINDVYLIIQIQDTIFREIRQDISMRLARQLVCMCAASQCQLVLVSAHRHWHWHTLTKRVAEEEDEVVQMQERDCFHSHKHQSGIILICLLRNQNLGHSVSVTLRGTKTNRIPARHGDTQRQHISVDVTIECCASGAFPLSRFSLSSLYCVFTLGTMFIWADYLVVSIIIGFSAAVGFYYAFTGGKQKTTSEYLLADRQMHWFPVAASLISRYAVDSLYLNRDTRQNYLLMIRYWLLFLVSYRRRQ